MASHESSTVLPPHTKDLTDQTFDYWTVLSYAGLQTFGTIRDTGGIRRHTAWWCVCRCGSIKAVIAHSLISHHSKSCGCRKHTHGISLTPRTAHSAEYRIFIAMWHRCTNPRVKQWMDYGGRGITVCTRWQIFDSFLQDMGPRPSPQHSLDRYPDMNGNYEPGNVRWATPLEQHANTRRNVFFTIHGVTHHLREWIRLYDKSPGIVQGRLERGWSIERALTQPPGKSGKHHPQDKQLSLTVPSLS